MIVNANNTSVVDRIHRLTRELPDAAPLVELLQETPQGFEYRVDAPGHELKAVREVDGRPNRATLKLFTVPDGPLAGRTAVFFYKPSLVPFSRDRFSYGVCIVPGSTPDRSEMDGWLAFADSGFNPEMRPRSLRLAFTFTVPD